MRVQRLGWLAFCLTVTSCSGWNSELDTAFVGDKSKDNAPVCEFKTENNCFTQSIDLIMACVQPVGASPEKMSADLDHCKNESGKVIRFTKPLDLFGVEDGKPIEFKVYNNQKTCFKFNGTTENFIIESGEFGRLQVKTLDNGDTQVSCFFDEGFIIPAQAKTLGCRDQKTETKNFYPSHNLKVQKQTQETGEVVFDHFQFSFLGAGTPVQPLFKCEL